MKNRFGLGGSMRVWSHPPGTTRRMQHPGDGSHWECRGCVVSVLHAPAFGGEVAEGRAGPAGETDRPSRPDRLLLHLPQT